MEKNSKKNQDPMIQADISQMESGDDLVTKAEIDESTKIIRPIKGELPLFIDPAAEENYY